MEEGQKQTSKALKHFISCLVYGSRTAHLGTFGELSNCDIYMLLNIDYQRDLKITQTTSSTYICEV